MRQNFFRINITLCRCRTAPHCRVFCPCAGALVHLHALPPGGLGAADVDVMDALPAGDELQLLSFLGPCFPSDDVAKGVACGAGERGERQRDRHRLQCGGEGGKEATTR